MPERPIIFTGPMVQALIDGRKSQTRRVVSRSHCPDGWHLTDDLLAYYGDHRLGVRLLKPDGARSDCVQPVPFHVGQRLWVREQWGVHLLGDVAYVKYRDGLDPCERPCTFEHYERYQAPPGRWRSPIHMPRWANRLTLIVTDVRVQRVQEISADDIYAEGTPGAWDYQGKHACLVACRQCFHDFWDTLNARRGFGWGANPWVVALTFSVHRSNIDALPAPETGGCHG